MIYQTRNNDNYKFILMMFFEWVLSYFLILYIAKAVLKLDWLLVLALFVGLRLFLFLIRLIVKIIFYLIYFQKKQIDNLTAIFKEANYPKGYNEIKNCLKYICKDTENKEETRLNASFFMGYFDGLLDTSIVEFIFKVICFEKAYKKYNNS